MTKTYIIICLSVVQGAPLTLDRPHSWLLVSLLTVVLQKVSSSEGAFCFLQVGEIRSSNLIPILH